MTIYKNSFYIVLFSLREQLNDVSLLLKVIFIKKIFLDLDEGQLKKKFNVCDILRCVKKKEFSASPRSIKYL
jgi:hypothetical protein